MEIEPATIAQVRAGRDGRVLTVEEDVFEVAGRLKEIDPSLHLRWNERGEYFVVYQLIGKLEEGGEEKLVLTAKELTPAIIARVEEIAHPEYDFVAEMDKLDKQADKDKDHRFHEQTGEAAERMAHAVRKDIQAKNKIILPKGV